MGTKNIPAVFAALGASWSGSAGSPPLWLHWSPTAGEERPPGSQRWPRLPGGNTLQHQTAFIRIYLSAANTSSL